MLQQVRSDSGAGVLGHPSHNLDKPGHGGWTNPLHSQGYTSEHLFELSVEGATGLQLVDTMIWGEADCFVQYHFPTQETPQVPGSDAIVKGELAF